MLMMDDICDQDQIKMFIDYLTEFGKNTVTPKIKGSLSIIGEAAKHYQKDLVPYLDRILSSLKKLISQKLSPDLNQCIAETLGILVANILKDYGVRDVQKYLFTSQFLSFPFVLLNGQLTFNQKHCAVQCLSQIVCNCPDTSIFDQLEQICTQLKEILKLTISPKQALLQCLHEIIKKVGEQFNAYYDQFIWIIIDQMKTNNYENQSEIKVAAMQVIEAVAQECPQKINQHVDEIMQILGDAIQAGKTQGVKDLASNVHRLFQDINNKKKLSIILEFDDKIIDGEQSTLRPFEEQSKVVLDESNYKQYQTEYKYYQRLLEFFTRDQQFKQIESEAPEFYKHIKSYEPIIQRKISICEWRPLSNQYGCEDLRTYNDVTKRKQQIWASFMQYKYDPWNRKVSSEQQTIVKNQCQMLVEYFTKYTDYMANEKITQKNLAVSREFLEPLKWNIIEKKKELLGNGGKLLTYCLDNKIFWKEMKKSHQILLNRYPCVDFLGFEFQCEVQQIEDLLVKKYGQYLVQTLPIDLMGLQDKESSMTYAMNDTENMDVIEYSIEENAQFLVKWANELYADFAIWITSTFKQSKASRKVSTLRIVDKIQEMYQTREISKVEDGWMKITDMLRAQCICISCNEVEETLDKLYIDQRVRILRIQPRIKVNNQFNDVKVYFEYQRQMICEIEIKIGKNFSVPILYQSSTLIQQIIKICETKNLQMLFEIYKRATIHSADNGQLIDSQLVAQVSIASEFVSDFKWQKNREMRKSISTILPKFNDVLDSDAKSFTKLFPILKINWTQGFANYLQLDQMSMRQKLDLVHDYFKSDSWLSAQYFEFIEILTTNGVLHTSTFTDVILQYDIFSEGVQKIKDGAWDLGKFEQFYEQLKEYQVFDERQFQIFMKQSPIVNVALNKYQNGEWESEAFNQFLTIMDREQSIKKLLFANNENNQKLLKIIIDKIEANQINAEVLLTFFKYLFEKKFLQSQYLESPDLIKRLQDVMKVQYDQKAWESMAYVRFLIMFSDNQIFTKEYMKEQITITESDYGVIPYIIKVMNSNEYPAQPRYNLQKSRERFKFDYKKLIENGFGPNKQNEFSKIKCDIDNFQGNLNYFGQVDQNNSTVPDGIGLIVDKEGEIIEGGFKNGNFGQVYRQIQSLYNNVVDINLYYTNPETKLKYNIKLQHQDLDNPPKFEYVERQKSKGVEEKYFWHNKNGEALFIEETGFNYRDYFTFSATDLDE